MLLDQLFGQFKPKELIIVRKDGILKTIAREIMVTDEEDEDSDDNINKPLFPISKERS